MKTLTIHEPYASLISEGVKKYEFRTWKTNYRGEILIHAGLSTNKEALKEFSSYLLNLNNGFIIAKCNITDCIKVDKEFKKILEKENPFIYAHIINDENYNGYAFKIENVVKIKPIKSKGKLSFWDYMEGINE